MIHTEPSRMRNEDAVQTSRQTILLVDDDAGISSLVADILEEEGYGVETVTHRRRGRGRDRAPEARTSSSWTSCCRTLTA